MKKNFIVSYEIYPFDIMVSVGETTEKLIKSFEKRGYHLSEKEKEDFTMEGVGRTVMFDSGATVLRLKSFRLNLKCCSNGAIELLSAA